MVLEGYAPHSPFDVTDTCRTGVRRDFHQPGWSAAALRPGRRLPTTGNTSRTREKRSIVLLPRSSKMGGSIGLHTHPGPYLAVQSAVRPPDGGKHRGATPPFTTPTIFVSSSSCSSLCDQHVGSVQLKSPLCTEKRSEHVHYLPIPTSPHHAPRMALRTPTGCPDAPMEHHK